MSETCGRTLVQVCTTRAETVKAAKPTSQAAMAFRRVHLRRCTMQNWTRCSSSRSTRQQHFLGGPMSVLLRAPGALPPVPEMPPEVLQPRPGLRKRTEALA